MFQSLFFFLLCLLIPLVEVVNGTSALPKNQTSAAYLLSQHIDLLLSMKHIQHDDDDFFYTQHEEGSAFSTPKTISPRAEACHSAGLGRAMTYIILSANISTIVLCIVALYLTCHRFWFLYDFSSNRIPENTKLKVKCGP